MLESVLNIHVSRCCNRGVRNYLGPAHKDLCKTCPGLEPVSVEDEMMMESLAEYVYPEIGGRPPELIDELMETHCKKCKSYSPRTGSCALASPEQGFVIRDLMENETLHCAKGEW
jgi:hypothetical protein